MTQAHDQNESYPAHCRQRAAECRRRAEKAIVRDVKAAFRDMEKMWLLAAECENTEAPGDEA
jgi:hypothetical protein